MCCLASSNFYLNGINGPVNFSQCSSDIAVIVRLTIKILKAETNMYSFHDIAKVCSKIEPVSDDDDGLEDDTSTDHSDNQSDRILEEYTLNNNNNNNNNVNIRGTERNFKGRDNLSFTERTATSEIPSLSDDLSISQRGQPSVDNTTAVGCVLVSAGTIEAESVNGQVTASVYENGGLEALRCDGSSAAYDQELYANNIDARTIPPHNAALDGDRESLYRSVWFAGDDQKIYAKNGVEPRTWAPQHHALPEADHESLYRSVWFAGDDQRIYAKQIEQRTIPAEQNALPQRLRGDQSNTHRKMPYVLMATKGEFSSCEELYAFNGTHRSLTLYEMGIQRKSCCHCPCHIPTPSYVLAPELKSQRPSVIMVPAKRQAVFSDPSSKIESVAQRLHAEKASLTRDMDYAEVVAQSDSSDDDENEKQEKYFRVNLDGTTARFKLTKEDWERIPINTFPSGGRLLSGDWTRIFLSKVKESNPWCSLRFKNNHVRSENSRKIHSAVFFRGGAECKRPECNVKVRFVIRKERGKHVEVTYVGNVCHSSNPGGSDATNGRKRRQGGCARKPSNI
ncbi:uncharacterized protein [Montipora foliosa]|uniref:uncharacterized protein isoform X1 n=2 Tax=Montipora foliosa TaxID=591990 RepID=UPI0035F1BD52